MAYVSQNYSTNASAPVDQWVCSPSSALGPYRSKPPDADAKGPKYCGQCVSFVKTVCPTIPKSDTWKKGVPVKGNTTLAKGTAVATFVADAKSGKDVYSGHAAIYESQDDVGMRVYDQWVTGSGKAIGVRVIRWNGSGLVNKGSNYYVIE